MTDGTEIEERGDRPARRREVAGGHICIGVERDAVQHVGLDAERPVEVALFEQRAKSIQAGRVIELVAVHPEDPGVGSCIRLEDAMRLACVPDTAHVDVIELAGQVVEQLPRCVRRHVVDCVDPVAERSHVAKRPLDMEILVPHESDPHDLHRLSAPHSSSRGVA
jgi:hypothetical protein